MSQTEIPKCFHCHTRPRVFKAGLYSRHCASCTVTLGWMAQRDRKMAERVASKPTVQYVSDREPAQLAPVGMPYSDHSQHSYTTQRATMAQQASRCDIIRAAVNPPMCPIAPLTITPTTQPHAAIQRAAVIDRNVSSLVRRCKALRRAQLQVWSVSPARKRWVTPTTGERYSLTHETRDIIQWWRNADTRERLAADISQLHNPTEDETLQRNLTSKPMRGVTAAHEVRVNTRGAYGKRSVKVQPNAQVSQRDARKPHGVLVYDRMLTVGCATDPEADARDIDELLDIIRTDPSRAALRLYRGPEDVTGTVVAVSEYTQRKAQRAKAKRTTQSAHSRIAAQARWHRSDVERFAATIGYMPEHASA